MNNRNQGYKSTYQDNQSRYFNGQQESDIGKICKEIEKAEKLSTILTVEKVSLPGGFADRCSNELANQRYSEDKEINPNQLRKFFDTAKLAEQKPFEEAKNSLYSLVPQIAYSVGRKLCPTKFFDLVKACINQQKIKDSKDIKAFVNFFEAILAYNKLANRTGGR